MVFVLVDVKPLASGSLRFPALRSATFPDVSVIVELENVIGAHPNVVLFTPYWIESAVLVHGALPLLPPTNVQPVPA
jgi:hypothetical protein